MDWYHFYPALYEADTLHFSLAQHGAYRRLIDFYMFTRQPIPDDDAKIAVILKVPIAEWQALAPAVRAMFKPEHGKLHQKRCDLELESQDRHQSYLNQLSKRGVEARKMAKSLNNKANATVRSTGRSTVRSTPPRNETEETEETEKKETARQDGSGLVSVSYWEVSPLTDRDIEQARKEFPGYDIEQAEREWIAWAASRGMLPPLKPGIAFLGWLDKRNWKKGNGYDH